MLEDFRLCDITEDAAMSGMIMSCGSDTYHLTQPEPILSPTETVKKKLKKKSQNMLKCESILQLR